MVIIEKRGNVYIERWKDGRTYKVIREKGRFKSRELYTPTPETKFVTPVLKPREPKKKFYRYDFAIRVKYVTTRVGHGRIGEIDGVIFSEEEKDDAEIIERALEMLYGADYWLDYAPVNEVTKIYIHKNIVDDLGEDYVSFKDLGYM